MIIRLLVSFLLTMHVAVASSEPKCIRIHVMTVGMQQAEYVKYTRMEKKDGFHAAAMQLVKQGKAEILDVNCVTARSGEKATLESVREVIYPTEYEPDELACPPPQDFNEIVLKPEIRTKTPTAFETRNTGTTLEVEPTLGVELVVPTLEDEPTLGDKGSLVNMRFTPEFVDPVGYALWWKLQDEFGKADIVMPKFLTHHANLGLTLRSGKFALANTFSGKDAEGNVDNKRKILVFVMAEVIFVKK